MRRDEGTLRLFFHPAAHSRPPRLSSAASSAEELRVLYVALTRAREKLLLVMTIKNPAQKLSSLAASLGEQAAVSPFAVRSAKSYADWLLAAALRHPDAAALRALIPEREIPLLEADFPLRTSVCPAPPAIEETAALPTQELSPTWLCRKKSAAG